MQTRVWGHLLLANHHRAPNYEFRKNRSRTIMLENIEKQNRGAKHKPVYLANRCEPKLNCAFSC